jgi:enoyl-CoA hydratase/carnithine racemase
MILTGRRVTAAEGLALGFVNEVCKPGEAVATAKKIAAQILECSPMSVRASKEAVYRGLTEPSLQAAIDVQRKYDAIRAMFTSEDLIEGPMAFAQKRPPQWKGK